MNNDIDYVKSEQRFTQKHSFEGLCENEHCHPSDMDLLFSLGKGKGYIYGESKAGNTQLPHAQYAILKDHVDDMWKGGTPCILIIMQHNTEASETVMEKDSIIREIYYGNGERWRPLWEEKKSITLNEFWKKVVVPYQKGIGKLTQRL